jgi:hypothetical protein
MCTLVCSMCGKPWHVCITMTQKRGAKTRLVFQEPKTATSRRAVPLPEMCLAALTLQRRFYSALASRRARCERYVREFFPPRGVS